MQNVADVINIFTTVHMLWETADTQQISVHQTIDSVTDQKNK